MNTEPGNPSDPEVSTEQSADPTISTRIDQVLAAFDRGQIDQMLEVLGSVLEILTLAVGALGAISLLVGGIGILTIMTISVRERHAEVGLLRALGSSRKQILGLFLGEAMILGVAGGLAGLALGTCGAWLLDTLVPGLPAHIAWEYALVAVIVSLLVGLVAGVAPALHAANLDPIEALHNE